VKMTFFSVNPFYIAAFGTECMVAFTAPLDRKLFLK